MAYTPKLTYKGRPLVRCGNDIYYGSMTDPYIIYLQVLSNKQENGVKSYGMMVDLLLAYYAKGSAQ